MSKASGSTVIPCLRYRDLPRAIDWLCRVFGFEKQSIIRSKDDRIVHAELVLGGGMLMLGSPEDGAYGRLMKQPDEIGGAETQTAYLNVSDADEVYRRVKAQGGAILIEIKDESYGGRGFTCRDPEGHVWYIGTYDPWQAR